MHLFWLQKLPLLLLIQLLQSGSTTHKTYAEALLVCKSALGTPRPSSWRIGRCLCIRQRACLNCYKPKSQAVVSLIPEICALSCASNFFPPNCPIQFQEKHFQSRNRRIAASVDGESGVPTLTPVQQDDIERPRKQRVAAIVGGVGAALLVIGFVVLVCICLMCVKRRIRRSEGESSVPSPAAELERGASPYLGVVSPIGIQNLRQLAILEMRLATNNFSESNIIGEGSFGLVYKGLLQDGSIVAIKRHLHTPIQNFLHEVKHIAHIHHRHLVKIVGFCEENYQQLLVYDYIPNGNVGNHLYDSKGLPIGKLNMRQRLLIALGAAKGLEHLHSLVPPIFHMHFRTSNVLLDENFTPKVSDYGILKMVTGGHHAASSSAIDSFPDPELNLSKNYSAGNDVYSFGVFLLELIGGHEANGRYQSNLDQTLVSQVKTSSDLDSYIDKTLGEQTVDTAAKEMMRLALQCVDACPRRPSMRHMVEELERIQLREVGRLHSEFVEDIGAVTLGSELFK